MLSGEYDFSSEHLRKILENGLPRSVFSPHSSWRDVNYETKLTKNRQQHLLKTQILDFKCNSQSCLLSGTHPVASMKKGSPQINLRSTSCHRAQGDSTIIQNKQSTRHMPIIQNKCPRVI